MNFFSEWVGNWKRAAGTVTNVLNPLKRYIDEYDDKGKDMIRFTEVPNSIANDDITISNYKAKIGAFINPPKRTNKDFNIVYNKFMSARKNFIAFLANEFNMSQREVINQLNSWTYGHGIGALFYKYYSDDQSFHITCNRLMENKYHCDRGAFDFFDLAQDIKRENIKQRNVNSVWG